MEVIATLALAAALAASPAPALVPDRPNPCADCAGWNEPRAPYRIFGNTYYVGTAGLSAILLTSPAGHVLLDAGLPQSAERIDASIRALGFRTQDVKLIVNSHAHFDHAGGIAALARFTGATVAASGPGARGIAKGGTLPEDPQDGLGPALTEFPAVRDVRAVADGETLRVGPIAVTAHLTPGHTPGSTTWTWKSCEGERCVDVVYADSVTPVSADGYRFTGGPEAAFRRGLAKLSSLPCGVLLTPHPSASKLEERAARAGAEGSSAFVDAKACAAYAAQGVKSLDARIEKERAEATKK
jgi:metallo-beta-lactamase class B